MIKELTQSNFPNTDIGGDMQGVTYIGLPMPDVHNYTDLSVFGFAVNQSVDSFISSLEPDHGNELYFCYSPGHNGDNDYLWRLTAYAKYEASENYPDKNIVLLYYSPVM